MKLEHQIISWIKVELVIIILISRERELKMFLLLMPAVVGKVSWSVSESRVILVTKTLLKSHMKRFSIKFGNFQSEKLVERENMHQSLV